MSRQRELGSILVATDFSQSAQHALERTALLPLGLRSSVELLHVAGERELTGEDMPRLEEARQVVQRALDSAGRSRHHVVVSSDRGRPFEEIARVAHHDHVELVVLGRNGERRFRHQLLGSTADRVIRHGDVSVLVVAGTPEGPYRKPLVAVDLSESSRLALELVLRLHRSCPEPVDVLRVTPHPAGEPAARAELVMFLAEIPAPPGGWNAIVRPGDPRAVILEQARRRLSDLIALGTKGRTGLPHVLLGSVAEAVLHEARADVLVARLPTADALDQRGDSSGPCPRQGRAPLS